MHSGMSLDNSLEYGLSRDDKHELDIIPSIKDHHLIVTTAGGVYSWCNRGSAQLLSSTSKGIVTATNMHTDKDLLAVADSQIVVLHNMEKGMQRTYRLRNENQVHELYAASKTLLMLNKGHIRKLFYHPDRQRLFFTTTLQNAVQSFSLQKVELLDAAPTHPSPPTVFAVSPACDLLVSASADPPTIYLSRITCKQPPLLFVPNCSNASVVSVCFHPTRANIFVLGFQDGTIAAYNATTLPVPQFLEERFSYAKIYGEISHIERLHKPVNQTSLSNGLSEAKQSSATDVPTISGIQFLPKRLCSVVSVGADRNCFVVDFQRHGRNTAEIVGTWKLHVAATSLAILELVDIPFQTDGQDDRAETNKVLLAVGKTDGTVSVYDKAGQLLATKDFSKDGRVLDLEWAQQSKNQFLPKSVQSTSNANTELSQTQPQQHIQDKDKDMAPLEGSRSPSASKIMVKLHVKSPLSDHYLLHGKGSTPDTKERSNQGASSFDGNAISVPEKQQPDIAVHSQDTGLDSPPMEDYTTAPETRSSASYRSKSRRSSRTTTSRTGSSVSSRRRQIPVIPSRPVPRPGGKLASRRVESTKGRQASISAGSRGKIVRTSTMKHFRFEDTDYDLPAPPSLHQRYSSSNISPLSEEPKLDFLAIPAGSLPIVTSPLASEPPARPLQYNRLTGPTLDAAPSFSMSRPSILGESDLGHRPAVPAKVNELRKDSLPPNGKSDTSTSAGSTLDWTPSAYLQIDTQQTRAPSFIAAKSKEATPPAKPSSQRQDNVQESDSSPTSQLDWHDDRNAVKVEGFDMLTSHQSSKSPSTAGKGKQINKQHRSTPLSPLAPLQNFRLRKRQTAINLKDKNGPTLQATPKKQAPAKGATDISAQPAIPPSLHLDPNQKKRPPIFSASMLIHETPPLSSEPAPIQPSAIPAATSTNTSTTRPLSSLHKSMPSSRQMRSSNSTAGWQSTYTIEDVIRIECAAVCTHVDAGFDEHKTWLQGLLREQNWYTVRLEEENRLLREEMARLRKG